LAINVSFGEKDEDNDDDNNDDDDGYEENDTGMNNAMDGTAHNEATQLPTNRYTIVEGKTVIPLIAKRCKWKMWECTNI
jgi:hypothetical protein